MDTIIRVVLIIAIICAIALSCATAPLDIHARAYSDTNLYPTCGVVIEVDESKDTVAFMEANGNIWEFTETEDWMVGDIVAVIMNDMGTSSVYDDTIVSVRYCGYMGNGAC